jgi:hypothetical protein
MQLAATKTWLNIFAAENLHAGNNKTNAACLCYAGAHTKELKKKSVVQQVNPGSIH